MHGRHLQGKSWGGGGGGGCLWDIKIFNATNGDHRRCESTLSEYF